MNTRIALIMPPVAMQPGNYVPNVYRDGAPKTPWVELAATRHGNSWHIELRWPNPEPVQDMQGNPSVFVDAAAVFCPAHVNASWLTMGSEDKSVEGFLWRADSAELIFITARGLGSTQRSKVPVDWRISARQQDGYCQLQCHLNGWQALDRYPRLGLAVWRGSAAERAGLKSVTPGWVGVDNG